MKQIQEWLGHSDISTTANICAHLDSQSKNLSARTMANTLTLPEAQPVKKWWFEQRRHLRNQVPPFCCQFVPKLREESCVVLWIAICRDCWYDLYRTRKSLLENKGEMPIKIASEFCKAIKNHYPMWNWVVILGADGGIRTHVTLLSNWFRVNLVTTASIRLLI